MSLLEQQNFLARIFTDEFLRLSFWENPEMIGKANGLQDDDIAQLKEIVAADFNFFAESLFHKRLHEVEKLLPLTKNALGLNFSKFFRIFSQSYQPITIKKHLEDAVQFCMYLQNQELEPIYAKDTAKFEKKRHEFYSKNKFISFCVLRHNVFNFKKKTGFSIWYRFGNHSNNFIL